MSNAENYATEANGKCSHAEGLISIANGMASHAEGGGTIASGKYQHVQGKYNVEDADNKYAHILGGGSDANNRKNIHTVDWDGNAEYRGDVTVHYGAQYQSEQCSMNSLTILICTEMSSEERIWVNLSRMSNWQQSGMAALQICMWAITGKRMECDIG